MLWKPATPVYPKLIQEAPEGLTKAEADVFREKGKKLLPICKLGKSLTNSCLLCIFIRVDLLFLKLPFSLTISFVHMVVHLSGWLCDIMLQIIMKIHVYILQ